MNTNDFGGYRPTQNYARTLGLLNDFCRIFLNQQTFEDLTNDKGEIYQFIDNNLLFFVMPYYYVLSDYIEGNSYTFIIAYANDEYGINSETFWDEDGQTYKFQLIAFFISFMLAVFGQLWFNFPIQQADHEYFDVLYSNDDIQKLLKNNKTLLERYLENSFAFENMRLW